MGKTKVKFNPSRRVFRTKKKLKKEIYRPFGLKIKEIRDTVLNYQLKLAKEIRNKNYLLASKTIKILTNSLAARAYALYLVLSKKGYRSMGLSKIKPATNSEYEAIIEELKTYCKNPSSYKSTPLSRKMVPKPKGGLRPISVPSYTDRAIQTLFQFALEVCSEELQGPQSFGFRRYRSPGWGQKAVTLAVWSRKGFGPPKRAVLFDIKGCYDNISHQYIMDNCSSIRFKDGMVEVIPKEILNQWLTCGYILVDDPGQGILPTSGVPQGGPISPTIANIVLAGFETHVVKAINNIGLKTTHDIDTSASPPQQSEELSSQLDKEKKKIRPGTYKFYITHPTGVKEEIYSYKVTEGTKTTFSQISKIILSKSPQGQGKTNRSVSGRLMIGQAKTVYGISCVRIDGRDRKSVV